MDSFNSCYYRVWVISHKKCICWHFCAVVALSDDEPSNRLGAVGGLIVCAIIGICAFAKSDILGNSIIP